MFPQFWVIKKINPSFRYASEEKCFFLYNRDLFRHDLDSPPLLNLRGASSLGTKPGQAGGLRTLRMGRKDYKKGGDALRGKNVTEAFRVKEKDLKRTGK